MNKAKLVDAYKYFSEEPFFDDRKRPIEANFKWLQRQIEQFREHDEEFPYSFRCNNQDGQVSYSVGWENHGRKRMWLLTTMKKIRNKVFVVTHEITQGEFGLLLGRIDHEIQKRIHELGPPAKLYAMLASTCDFKERRQRAAHVFGKLDGKKQQELLSECADRKYAGKDYESAQAAAIAKIMKALAHQKA